MQLVSKGHKDQLVFRGHKGHKGHKELLGQLDRLVQQAHLLDQAAQQVHKVIQVQ